MHDDEAARRSEIARTAAKARWREDRKPTVRVTFTITEEDHASLEILRLRFGEASHGGVVRKLLRQAMKGGAK